MADSLTRLIIPTMTMVIITMARKRGIVMEGIVSEYFSGRIASKHRLIAVLDPSPNQHRFQQDLPIEGAGDNKSFPDKSFKARFVSVRVMVQGDPTVSIRTCRHGGVRHNPSTNN